MAPLTTANIPPLAWGLGYMYGYLSLISARLQRDDDALNYLQLLLLWLERAPAWTVGFPEMTCLAAETLWRLERRDQVGVVEQAVREKVLKPDFRSTMVDGRLALARLCALSGRHDEAQRWFAEARLRPRRTGRPSAARHCRLRRGPDVRPPPRARRPRAGQAPPGRRSPPVRDPQHDRLDPRRRGAEQPPELRIAVARPDRRLWRSRSSVTAM